MLGLAPKLTKRLARAHSLAHSLTRTLRFSDCKQWRNLGLGFRFRSRSSQSQALSTLKVELSAHVSTRSMKLEAMELTREFDSWYDAKNSRNLKRRRMNFFENSKKSGNVKMEIDDIVDGDEDYATFLEIIRREDDDLIHLDSQEDEVDPDYKTFWEDLNKDGEDEVDPCYKTFLEDLNKDGEDDVDPCYKTFLEDLNKDGEDDDDPDYKTFLKNLIKGEADIDPDYKTFLENLREDGKSYIFKWTQEDGTTNFVKYEEIDVSSVDIKKEGINISTQARKDLKGTVELQSEPLNRGFGKPFLSDCKQTAAPVDESYYLFLSQVRVDGHLLILECEDGIVKYEEDNEILTDSEGLAKGGNPCSGGHNFTPIATPEIYDSDTDEDDGVYVQSLNCVDASSEYKEKLKKSLKVPFNKKEFDGLLEAAKTHKPLERMRNLRGRVLSYPTHQIRLSYLDYYPDLAAMIENAISRRDRYRALSFLRCLFFYLKNLSHEGAFMPWKNNSTLEMIETRNYR